VSTPHGQIRVRVAASATRLLRFTVPDICRETGFLREQVYPVLQKLEEEHFLVVRPLTETEPKANRPLNIYSVTEDAETKRQLLDEIKKFLPSDHVYEDSESLARARAGLERLPARLLSLEQTADELPAVHDNRRAIGELKEQIETVGGDLEIALYEFGVTEETEPPAPLQAAIEKLHAYRQDLTSIEARVVAIEERLEAQKKASRVLRRVVRRYYESVEPTYALFQSMPDALFANKLLEQPAWTVSLRQREHQRALISSAARERLDFYRRVLDKRYQHAGTFQLKAILSDFNRELASAVELSSHKPSEPMSNAVWQALYELAIRYGDNPQTALGVLSLSEQGMPRDLYTAYYDAINFQFIAGSHENAFSSWRDWTEKRVREEITPSQGPEFGQLQRAFYRSMLFAAVPAADLNEQLLAKVKEALGIAFSFSIVSAARLDSLGPPSHVIEPTLTSPLRSSETVRLSESMRIATPELHVYGPIENVLRVPGVPKIAFATALAGLGLPSSDAWAFATSLEFQKALIVINSQEPAQTGILPRFAKVAEIISSAISGWRSIAETGRLLLAPGESVTEVERPALYERDPQDALRRVDELGFAYERRWLTSTSHE
jgi:DNA-binding PadR family transcriptional regulator